MNTETNDKLMTAAAQLSTEIAPQRDLWPGIEARLESPARRSAWTPMLAQAAAILLLVGASSGITYVMTRSGSSVSPVIVTTGLDSEFVSFGSEHELGEGFQDARSNLAADLDLELDRLSPDARAGVEENLAVIRSAIIEINSAMEAEPDSDLLQELLMNAYREELAVMGRVGGLTHKVMARNDI